MGGLGFFCLFWLRMTPEQVAEMFAPDDPDLRNQIALFIRGRWEYARRHAVIEQTLHPDNSLG